MTKRVVIIGAGIGGLATANILAKAGYDVVVYEKNSQPGGRAGMMEVDGFRFDTGPSWYLMPDVFDQYFSLFGTSSDEQLNLVKLSPAYKVFFENAAPVVITSNPKQDAETFEKIEPGAGKKLLNYVEKGDEIYRLSLKHFLYTNFTSLKDFAKTDIVRRGRLMTRLALTPIDRYVKKFVKDQRLQQILEYPMVFLGTSPFSAPALYSLMSALDFREGVFYPQGGLYTIIEKLVEIGKSLGVAYHYDSAIEKIISKKGVTTGIQLAGGEQIHADIIISNADLHFTETKLLAEKDRSYPSAYWANKEPGPSALLMYLGVEGKLSQMEHHNLFFVKDWEKNFKSIFETKELPTPASIYVCKPSATDPTVAPKNSENLFVLVPLPPGINTSKESLDEVANKYLAQIEKHFDIPDLQKRIKVRRLFGPHDFENKYNAWQGTALGPSHVLRQSALFRTKNYSRKLKNLYYVGGFTTPGIGLPMCLIGAEMVYKRIIGDKTGGPVTHIERISKQ